MTRSVAAMGALRFLSCWFLLGVKGDESENCAIWAEAGECSRNAAYMLKANSGLWKNICPGIVAPIFLAARHIGISSSHGILLQLKLFAGLRGELFGRFKHRLRKVPGLGSCRGMQQESCLHAEGQGTCTHIFRFYILMHFKLFCHYRLGRHLCHKSCFEMWLVWKSRPIFCDISFFISSQFVPSAPGVCQLLSICETGDGWMQTMGYVGRMRSESRIHAAEVCFHMRPLEAGPFRGGTWPTATALCCNMFQMF